MTRDCALRANVMLLVALAGCYHVLELLTPLECVHETQIDGLFPAKYCIWYLPLSFSPKQTPNVTYSMESLFEKLVQSFRIDEGALTGIPASTQNRS